MRVLVRLGSIVSMTLLWSSIGRAAWVETQVKAHTATLDVARDGSALVRHEILLGVRGGPLREYELQGVDVDAEPVGEATATPVVRYGVPAPIPLVLTRTDDGTLRIDIQHEKGLRTGSYTFAFEYKTELLGRDRIRRRGTSAELEWVGPRFADGVDVAKVILRLPEGPLAPVLPSGADGDDAVVMGSAFLSSVRHAAGKVEMEIIRPHVARGEPAVWRVWTSPKAFDGLPEPTAAKTAAKSRIVSMEQPNERLRWIGAAAALALLYGALVLLKWSLHRRDCQDAHAEPRALVRLPIGARAALSGAFLAGAASLGAHGDYPTWGGFALLLAMALAALRSPKVSAPPRGPGQWLAFQDADAFDVPSVSTRGRWLDAGTWRGFGVLALLLSMTTWAAVRLAQHTPYHALGTLLLALALAPIFGTGRDVSLPFARARTARRFLRRVVQGVRRSGIKAVAWVRIPDGCSEPDELRLLLRVPRAKDGLQGIEIGLEHLPSEGGFGAFPFLLVRAREDSEAQRALPRTLTWQRGRRPEERVAVVRPGLPTAALSAAIAEELVARLSGESATKSRSTSSVRGTKLRTGVRSPAHAA
ncbi:MAG TPA: hypothetical protein VIM73_22315 [Polyangiaceae bacterium]